MTDSNQAAGGKWIIFASYCFLAIFSIAFLVPPIYTIITSLKSSSEISAQTGNPWIVVTPTLENYISLLKDRNFHTYFLNSAMVTLSVVLISMAISIPAAYGLTRLRFRGSDVLATGIFLVYLVPPSLLFIPLFQVVNWFGLINSTWSLVILYPTLAVPFCTWMLIGYFSSIPKELDEAAVMDGAGFIQILTKILIPIAIPGIIASTIFAFTVSWGAFLYPMAYLYSSDQMVLTVGIVSDLIKGDVFEWGKLMAANVLACLPPIIIYILLMDFYVSGLTAGAVKD